MDKLFIRTLAGKSAAVQPDQFDVAASNTPVLREGDGLAI